jgi:hypothetical protein
MTLRARRPGRRPPTDPLPDLYAQLTPYAKRLSPNSTRYWLSGYPELVAQWHPTKNGIDLFPDNIRYGSPREVWWKCAGGPDHEWTAAVTNRVRGAGCPFCTNKYASVTNSLASLRPDVAAEWHPTLNKPLRPRDVVAGSARRIWWKCPKASDHVWQAMIVMRTLGGGSESHGSGCPFCSGNRVTRSNCLATVAPKIARQWHPTKNGALTPRDVTPGSNKRVWWRCAKGHEWQTTVGGRASKERGCPYCAGFLATPTTSLAAQHPEIARQWHPTRNGPLTPADVKPFTQTAVWWQCPRGHEWRRAPARQMRHGTCPFCSGHRVAKDNSLRAVHPELARQWHPTRNRPLTPNDVTARSGKRVWWRCTANPRHLWEAMVHSRTNTDPPSGCPHCWAIRRRGG